MPRSPQADEARRRFLKSIGLAGVSSALAPAAFALAQSSTPPGSYPPGVPPPHGKAATPTPAAPAAGAKPEPPSEDARSLGEIVRRRYGKQWSPEQAQSVVNDFDSDLKAAERLHKSTLENGDEPDFTFHP